MAIILYFINGLSLLRYVISPAYRRKTNARWKVSRHYRVVFEIGTGLIGLVALCALALLVLHSLVA